jgi:hypothetical protein
MKNMSYWLKTRTVKRQEFCTTIQSFMKLHLSFNKQFSHAVIKPVDGDFRVQSLFEGKYTFVANPPLLIKQAQKK